MENEIRPEVRTEHEHNMNNERKKERKQDGESNSQPIHNTIMRKREDELVHDAIDAHGTADELERRVGGVAEDEALAVEAREGVAAHAARQHGHVVDVRLVDHGAHGLRHRARRELVRRVLVPDGLEVEDRAAEGRAEKREAARVGDARGGVGEGLRGREDEVGRGCRGIVVVFCARVFGGRKGEGGRTGDVD